MIPIWKGTMTPLAPSRLSSTSMGSMCNHGGRNPHSTKAECMHFMLLTNWRIVSHYSKPQPSLMPDINSTLRLITQWNCNRPHKCLLSDSTLQRLNEILWRRTLQHPCLHRISHVHGPKLLLRYRYTSPSALEHTKANEVTNSVRNKVNSVLLPVYLFTCRFGLCI